MALSERLYFHKYLLDAEVKNYANEIGALEKEYKTQFDKEGYAPLIDELQKQEKQFLSLFPDLTGSTNEEKFEQLQKDIITTQKEVENLSGVFMQMDFIVLLDAEIQKQQELALKIWKVAAQELFVSEEYKKGVSEFTAKQLYEIVIGRLNESVRHTTSFQPRYEAKKELIDKLGIDRLFLAFSGEQKRGILTMIVDRIDNDANSDLAQFKSILHKGGVRKVGVEKSKETARTLTLYNSITIQDKQTATVALESTVEKMTMTKTQAREKYDPKSDALKVLNESILEVISKKIGDSARPLVNKIFRDIILVKDPYAFFVGQAPNALIGLLGEVQALYLFYSLLKPKKEMMTWTGSISGEETGWQAPIDILLEDIGKTFKVGIQVKNSVKELTNISNIPFSDTTLDYFLKKVGITDNNDSGVIKSIYSSVYFNKQYITTYQDGKPAYSLGDNPRFVSTENQLIKYKERLNILFEVFVVILMSLSTGKILRDKMPGSAIFVVGSGAIIAASTILEELQQELKDSLKSSFTVSSYKKGDGGDIASYLQEYQNSQSKNTFPHWKHVDDDAYQKMVSAIHITSSFNFSSLIKKVLA